MKKLLFSLLLALSLVMSLAACAHAEARLDFVNDYAGVLTNSERQTLNDSAAQVSAQSNCGVYVVIVNNYRDYVNGLGYGESENGVILGMSMNDRDFDIYAHGDFGNYAFTDYGKGKLAETFLDNFRRNDWAGGLRNFVENSGEMLRRARDGTPVNNWIPDEEPPFTPFEFLVSLLFGCTVGGVTVGGMSKKMKTAVKQTRASGYVAQGGVTLRAQSDQFVNRTVSRRVIQRNNGNRAGGHYGGTTISGSHGGSHHSGKF